MYNTRDAENCVSWMRAIVCYFVYLSDNSSGVSQRLHIPWWNRTPLPKLEDTTRLCHAQIAHKSSGNRNANWSSVSCFLPIYLLHHTMTVGYQLCRHRTMMSGEVDYQMNISGDLSDHVDQAAVINVLHVSQHPHSAHENMKISCMCVPQSYRTCVWSDIAHTYKTHAYWMNAYFSHTCVNIQDTCILNDCIQHHCRSASKKAAQAECTTQKKKTKLWISIVFSFVEPPFFSHDMDSVKGPRSRVCAANCVT